MEIAVKVVLDQKEYDRLLDVEKKYNDLLAHHESIHQHEHVKQRETTQPTAQKSYTQTGAGAGGNCACQSKDVPLSQIIAENVESDAVQTPIAGILPSITTPTDSETLETGQKKSPKSEEPTRKASQSSKGSKEKSHLKKLTEAELEELGYPATVYPWYFIGAP